MPFKKQARWKKRKKRNASGGKKLLYWLLATALLLAILIILPALTSRHGSIPVSGTGGASGEEPGVAGSAYVKFLQMMLGYNVPGLEPPPPADSEQVYGLILDTFHSLTGVDPRDPRSILEMELGLGTKIDFLPPGIEDTAGGEDTHPDPPAPDNTGSFIVPPFYPFPFQGYNEPVLLLYHTHITETFVPTAGVCFTENQDLNMARLGEELAKLLRESYGLPLIHDRQVFDLPRGPAYEKARPAVQKILADNSQVNMVVDLHREGMPREVTTTVCEGRETGKIMIVIGTRNPGWETNFALAMRLQQELEAVAPGLSRGIRRQNFVYNQDLHPAAILVEVGGHENTLDETLLAIPYLAEALARTYYLFFVTD